MYGLRGRAWWGLAAFAVLILLFRAGDIFLGAGADPRIARGVTWRTPAELEAESAEAYRMFDRTARTQALSLVVMGYSPSPSSLGHTGDGRFGPGR